MNTLNAYLSGKHFIHSDELNGEKVIRKEMKCKEYNKRHC